jgi:uncharacterized integral membrane protein
VKYFLWLALLITIAVAIFAIQNSALAIITMKFLAWRLDISPLYAILASLVSGMLIMLLVWVPIALRASLGRRRLKKEIRALQRAASSGPKESEPKPG